jgi:hypothetical protein
MRTLPFITGALAFVLLVTPALLGEDAKTPLRSIEFNRDIRPLLADTCFTCHGPAKTTRKADLRLDVEQDAFADRGGYHVLVPGSLTKSVLWERITATELSKRMPPAKSGRKLTPQQIELIRLWIEQGAKWQPHWAFVPPQRPPLPTVKNGTWPKTPIDFFILYRLEQEKLQPSPEAAKETLIRRVTLDLTGLPPTLKEIDAFLKDRSANAYEKVVDRLLASPRYGERMVLEWLDAARYSDTNGYQTDGTRAMWPWRDWVIKALNDNMPFDRFTIEQLAGDLLSKPTIEQKIATGFHRNHMLNGEGGRIAEESRVDYVVDRVDTTGTVWLGLTVGCARCHEHKYDPLPQKEYYQVYAYFNNINETGGVDRRNGTAAPVLELPTEEQKQKIAAARKAVTELERQSKAGAARVMASTSWPVLAAIFEWQARAKELDKAKKTLTTLQNAVLITMVMEERPKPRETFVLIRGAYDKYGDKVQPGVPQALPAMPKGSLNNRLGLAQWLVSKENPLTARVTVNRYWQQFFGTGLVKTAEDFGVQGEPPSHPELLDWLASEFMKDWNVKRLHKLMVTSAAYAQSSAVTPTLLEKDPDNRLVARGPRLRLSPFLLRDQALALNGLLVDKMGGPPVKPYQPPGLWEDFSFNQIRYVQDHGESLYRRSLYTFWRRSLGPPNMFDTTARQVCTVRQSRTNTPLHSLILFNDVTFVEAARVWAERLLKQPGTPEERLGRAFHMATARRPSSDELRIVTNGLQRLLSQYRADREAAQKLVGSGEYPRNQSLDVIEVAAYTAMLNTILNLDEVITKE